MALGPRLDLRQTQSLVMTPQLQQAIKLLALSNLEIETFIGEELEHNPLLEAGEAATPPRERSSRSRHGTAHQPRSRRGRPLIGEGDGGGDPPLDIDYAAETFIDDSPADGDAALRPSPATWRRRWGGDLPRWRAAAARALDSTASPARGHRCPNI